MQKRILIAAIAASLSLPLALHAADGKKKGGPYVAADKNGDGKLDVTEYVAAVAGKMDDAAAKKKFADLDKDGDKFLSRQEFNAGAGQKGGKDGEKTGGKKKTDGSK